MDNLLVAIQCFILWRVSDKKAFCMQEMLLLFCAVLKFRSNNRLLKFLSMGLNIKYRFSSTELLRTGIVHLSLYVTTSYTALLCTDHIKFGLDNFGLDWTGTENFGSDQIRKFQIFKLGQLADCRYPIPPDAHL